MISPQIIYPVSVQADPEYSWLNLNSADGVLDPNNLLSSGPTYDSETKVNSVVIDMNQGAPVLDLNQALIYYWDINRLAREDFGFRFDLQFTNDAALQSSGLACCLGLTSDIVDFDLKGFAAGANYQTADLRAWRCKGTARSVGGLGATTEGVRGTCIRTGGNGAGGGNVASNYHLQSLNDSDWEGSNNFYAPSAAALDAANPTDPLYLFFAVQVITVAVTTKQMDVKIKVSPFVTSS